MERDKYVARNQQTGGTPPQKTLWNIAELSFQMILEIQIFNNNGQIRIKPI